jgi:FkbM family methyltransferase
VLFDVGANVGTYSKALYAQFPKARIAAFEPMPATFDTLRRTLAATTVKCYSTGLSDAEGTAIIYDYDEMNGEHASLYAGVLEELHHATKLKKTQVQLITLDAFCRTNGITGIDFLKIDAEGNELKVLQGARSMIQSNAIRAIQFEFNEMNVMSRVFLRDFYDVLKGFSFYRLLPDGLLPLGRYSSRNEIFVFQNILAINDATVGGRLKLPRISDSRSGMQHVPLAPQACRQPQRRWGCTSSARPTPSVRSLRGCPAAS